MIGAGKYRARAVGKDAVQYGFTKAGNPQVAVEFEVLGDGLDGERVTWFGVFAPGKSTDIAMKALRTAGWTGDEIEDLVGLGSTEVELVVEDEEWDGKVRTKVRWVNAPGGGGRVELQSQMTDTQRRAFSERMRSQAIASRPGGRSATGGAPSAGPRPMPPTPSAARAPAGASGFDDDIPF